MIIEEYIEKSKHFGAPDRRGTNSYCYLFDDYALLRGSIPLNSIDKLSETLNDYYKDNVAVMRIIEYKVNPEYGINDFGKYGRFQEGWILQEKALGKELYLNINTSFNIDSLDKFPQQFNVYFNQNEAYISELERINQASEEQINKFTSDLLKIFKDGKITIDPSKSKNFFFDPSTGFSLIDLALADKKSNNPELDTINVLTYNILSWPRTVTIEEENNISSDKIFGRFFTQEQYIRMQICIESLRKKITNSLEMNSIDKNFIEQEIDKYVSNNFNQNSMEVFENKEEMFLELNNKLQNIISSNIDRLNNPNKYPEQFDPKKVW